MKILFFTASFPPPSTGGSVEYIYNILSYLPPQSVIVHTGNEDHDEAKRIDKNFPQKVVRNNFIIQVVEGYRAGKLKRLYGYTAWPVAGLLMIIKERPDIIHIGEHNFAGIAALLALKIFRIPYIIYTYAEELIYFEKRKLHNLFFLTMLRNAAAVITVSEYTRKLLLERGVQSDRIHKILPAVSKRKCFLSDTDEIKNIREKYELNNQFVLLTVGGLFEKKGHTTVIEALPHVLKLFKNTKYIIVGTGNEDEKLKKQAKRSGLENHIIFVGNVDDKSLRCLYQICDVFILAHRQLSSNMDTEGCPTVFLEASAHGKPVIGGNAGGVADAIIDKGTGYIIDGTDSKMIAEKVCYLFNNPGVAYEMGVKGREYVSGLTPERNAKQILDVSQKVVRNGIENKKIAV